MSYQLGEFRHENLWTRRRSPNRYHSQRYEESVEEGAEYEAGFAEDPSISAQPKLTLIIEGEIPPELVNEIRKLPGTRTVTVY